MEFCRRHTAFLYLNLLTNFCSTSQPVAAVEPEEAAEEVAADEDDVDEEEKPEVIEVGFHSYAPVPCSD